LHFLNEKKWFRSDNLNSKNILFLINALFRYMHPPNGGAGVLFLSLVNIDGVVSFKVFGSEP
jgi:hypothetical protein